MFKNSPVLVPLLLWLSWSTNSLAFGGGNNICTVRALGHKRDDVPQIREAFQTCGHGGTIVFPEEESYWIASPLTTAVNDVVIQWHGKWTFSDDIPYWRNHSIPIYEGDLNAGFIVSGHNISIDGYGTGGIDGNGNIWYTTEAGDTQPGRPMPFVFWNVSSVTVLNFYIKDPPMWSINVMNGTDIRFDNILCNATAPTAPPGANWVQNTDGFDTVGVKNVQLTNFVYKGGDDCVALKEQSYNVYIQNVTCIGGNGIAIGSLGEYLKDSSVANVIVDRVKIVRDLKMDRMDYGSYIKTWIGVPLMQSSWTAGGVPRGGGWGRVQNIIFSNFDLQGATHATGIMENQGDNGSYPATSLLEVSNVVFANFSGYLVTDDTTMSKVKCSYARPCYNIDFKNITVFLNNSTDQGVGVCNYTLPGAIRGLPGC